MAAVLQVPWFVLCFFGLIFAVGDYQPNGIDKQAHFFGTLVPIPAALGALAGVAILCVRRPQRGIEILYLLAGTILCVLLAVLLVKIW